LPTNVVDKNFCQRPLKSKHSVVVCVARAIGGRACMVQKNRFTIRRNVADKCRRCFVSVSATNVSKCEHAMTLFLTERS